MHFRHLSPIHNLLKHTL